MAMTIREKLTELGFNWREGRIACRVDEDTYRQIYKPFRSITTNTILSLSCAALGFSVILYARDRDCFYVGNHNTVTKYYISDIDLNLKD